MGNEKKSIVTMIIVTVIAIVVCVATVIIMQKKPEPQVVKKPIMTEPKKEIPKKIVKKKAPKAKVVTVAPKSEKNKKTDEAKEWKEAGAELASLLQGTKFKEMMMRRMSERNKAYLKDLFEKYDIDEKTQNEIAALISESQSQFMETLMTSGGMQGKIDDAAREKLTEIQQNTENQITDLSSSAFLADAKDKRKNELKDNYMNRLDRNMKDNKMSSDQRTEMDALYSENQVTDAERLTLPPSEIKQREDNIDNGAKDILDDDQYKNFKKSSSGSPFGSMGMRMGGRRRR